LAALNFLFWHGTADAIRQALGDAGRIAEAGKFNTLMAANGPFTALAQRLLVGPQTALGNWWGKRAGDA
jgi:hypothetical protein